MPAQRNKPTAPDRSLVDRDHPLLAEAIRLWDRAEFERSLYTYEQALAADPRNARIIINAARAFFRRNRPAKGAELLDALVRAMPDDARVHHMVAETRRLMTLPAQATASFETARRLGDRSTKAALELAALYEQAGRLDESRRLVDDVLAVEPTSAWAALLRAQLLRRAKRYDDAVRALQELLARADPRSETACQAWAELATVHDAAADYAAATAAIERCKAPQREAEGPAWRAAQHVAQRFGDMIANLDAARVDAWRDRFSAAPGAPSPIALLGGFPRSGTTLLEQVIDAHPRVASIEERDVLAYEIFPSLVHGHAIDAPVLPIIDSLTRKQISRARERYAAALRDWRVADGTAPTKLGALLLDKNPGATPLIPILRALFTDAPLLIAVRDPRDVVLSCYLRYLRLNPLNVNFLTIERTAAKYAMDMGAWLRYRDLYPERWIEVKYEELVADLPGVARRVLEVLGVPWDDAVLAYRERLEHKIVASPTYDKVREPVTKKAVGRWRNYETLLAPALPVLAPFVRAFGYE